MTPLAIAEMVAYHERAGDVWLDYKPGENGLASGCLLCPGQTIWTEDLQRYVCSRPECPGRDKPSLHADAWHFKHEGAGGFAEEVVVTSAPRGTVTTTTASDRYAGRRVDLHALLAQPPQPTPWRVHGLVADGTLTIVAGEAGSGKSWLAQALCTGVSKGHAVAGLPCAKGQALYVDGEMGPRMFVDQRLRPAGVTTAEFEYIDAMGLDVSKPDDLAWLRGEIESVGARFVVIDSLRRLMPSKSENDSDDMAPAVAAVAKLARDTWAAILLIHHKGVGEKFSRGSTAIDDQCDALFGLLRDPDDEHAPRRLRCRGRGKMRYALEPPDVFLVVDPEAGGVAAADAPEAPGPVVPMRAAVAEAIEAAMPAKFKTEVAEKIGRDPRDGTFCRAWDDLVRTGRIVKIGGGWKSSSQARPLGDPVTTTFPNGAVEPNRDATVIRFPSADPEGPS